MPHFFNRNNPDHSTVQLCNLFCAGVLAIDYLTNPEASASESGFAMATYAASIIALGENSSIPTAISGLGLGLVLGLNIARLGAMYVGLTNGITAWTLETNIVDTIIRSATALELLFDEPSNPVTPFTPVAPVSSVQREEYDSFDSGYEADSEDANQHELTNF